MSETRSLKGLILAGGSGRRLRPLTHTGAKQLVPVANRPVLFYVIDNLIDAGVQDIGVIISPETGGEIRAALGENDGGASPSPGATPRSGRPRGNFVFIEQDRPGGLAHAVLCARDFLGDDPFVMYLGDNLVGAGIRDMASEFLASPDVAAMALLKEVANPGAFGVAEVDDDGNVLGLVEKPATPASNLALVGVYFFRQNIFDAIAEITPSARGELEITDAIARLITRGETCRFSRLTSWWLDTGKKDDMLLANDTVLDDWLTSETLGQVDEHSAISGRVRIEAGAVVERSRIRGPVVIGASAHIIDSVIGPYTSIGDRARIVRSRVDHSILMEEAVIEDVDRLEDSLLGRRVRVCPANRRGAALALMVGDDSVVELDRGATPGANTGAT